MAHHHQWPKDDEIFTEHLAPRLSLAFLHCLTLLAVWLFRRALVSRVDGAHPVFAVVRHDATAMLAAAAASVAAILLNSADYDAHKVPVFCQIAVRSFHQWAFFVVSALR